MIEFLKKYQEVLQEVVDAARVVTIFDGTDRKSLDKLQESLFRLGALQIEWEENYSATYGDF